MKKAINIRCGNRLQWAIFLFATLPMTPPNRHPEPRSYVTVLSDESYLKGVLTLHYSLMQTYPAYPLLVLLNDGASAHTQQVLAQANIAFKILPKLHYSAHSNASMQQRGWDALLNNTADKLSVFTLTEYAKIVYLDADMLVLKNIDYLFRYPHGSAVIDAGNIIEPLMQGQYNAEQYAYAHQFNSGLFVCQPNADDYQRCLALLQTEDGFDQEILRRLWADWQASPQRHLPQTCNIFAANMAAYITEGVCGFTDIEVLHYVYQPKPWHKTDFNIHTTQDFIYFIYQEYLQKALRAANLV